MRFLFAHQNFPGQYLHLVRRLIADGSNEVVYISEPNGNDIPGVRRISYRAPRAAAASVHPAARDLELALRRAEAVARVAAKLKVLGFVPDIVIGHHGWGELLDIADVFPGVPVLGYFEFFYRLEGLDVGFDPEFRFPMADYPRVRARNAVNLLALALPGHGQTPTKWQLATYPEWARERISLLPEGVDLNRCRPDPQARRRELVLGTMRLKPGQPLLTYVARDLEPYRGFHVLMRSLPALLKARRALEVAIVGGDGVSYGDPPPQGTWRQAMLAELGPRLDQSRVHFLGRLPYDDFLALLQRSDVHVYLTYPFVSSWSLREALAVGAAVVAADVEPVREFVSDGMNGLLTPCLDPKRLAERVLEMLENAELSRSLRAGARSYAMRHLDLDDSINAYRALIGRLTGRVPRARATPAPTPVLPARRPRVRLA